MYLVIDNKIYSITDKLIPAKPNNIMNISDIARNSILVIFFLVI
jgi:hypothetical protein